MATSILDDGHGSIDLYFGPGIAFHSVTGLTEYVRRHLERRAISGTVRKRQSLRCQQCGTLVTKEQIDRRKARQFEWIQCNVCDERIVFDVTVAVSRTASQLAAEIDSAANRRRSEEINASIIRGKEEVGEFDVFLAHNNEDKAVVVRLADALRRRGVNPWLDVEQVPPGRWFQDLIQTAIPKVRAAAVILGPTGLGRWERVELRSFISRCVEQGLPLIPILRPGVRDIPDDLVFLRELNRVQFTRTIEEELPLARLEWGITGNSCTVGSRL